MFAHSAVMCGEAMWRQKQDQLTISLLLPERRHVKFTHTWTTKRWNVRFRAFLNFSPPRLLFPLSSAVVLTGSQGPSVSQDFLRMSRFPRTSAAVLKTSHWPSLIRELPVDNFPSGGEVLIICTLSGRAAHQVKLLPKSLSLSHTDAGGRTGIRRWSHPRLR